MAAPGDDQGRRFPPVRKSLGQHFLTDRRILERIVDALNLTGSETVVEIGPGRGALTDILVEQAGRLVAVEYDRALAAMLRARYAERPNVEIIQADVLDRPLGTVAGDRGAYRVVGNVPYNVTTPIIFHGLVRPRPEIAVYLVQREVAERIVADPGSKAYGALSVNVQAVAHAELLFRVPAGAFQPAPKVESAVIRIRPRADPVVEAGNEDALRQLVQGAFGMRRKQMKRIIRTLYLIGVDETTRLLTAAEIALEARPEVLGASEFARLLGEIERARLTPYSSARSSSPPAPSPY